MSRSIILILFLTIITYPLAGKGQVSDEFVIKYQNQLNIVTNRNSTSGITILEKYREIFGPQVNICIKTLPYYFETIAKVKYEENFYKNKRGEFKDFSYYMEVKDSNPPEAQFFSFDPSTGDHEQIAQPVREDYETDPGADYRPEDIVAYDKQRNIFKYAGWHMSISDKGCIVIMDPMDDLKPPYDSIGWSFYLYKEVKENIESFWNNFQKGCMRILPEDDFFIANLEEHHEFLKLMPSRYSLSFRKFVEAHKDKETGEYIVLSYYFDYRHRIYFNLDAPVFVDVDGIFTLGDFRIKLTENGCLEPVSGRK